MLSTHFRYILSSTFFAPVLLLYCANDLLHRYIGTSKCTVDAPIPLFIIWIVILLSSLSIFLCSHILKRSIVQSPPSTLKVKTFNRRDQGVLSFVLIFLLPFIWVSSVSSTIQFIFYLVIFAVITIVMTDISAYQYNLVMRILRYRFYIIKDDDDIDCLFITKKQLRTPNIKRDVIQLYEDVYIAINEDKYD